MVTVDIEFVFMVLPQLWAPCALWQGALLLSRREAAGVEWVSFQKSHGLLYPSAFTMLWCSSLWGKRVLYGHLLSKPMSPGAPVRSASPFVSGCLPLSMVPRVSPLDYCCWKPWSPFIPQSLLPLIITFCELWQSPEQTGWLCFFLSCWCFLGLSQQLNQGTSSLCRINGLYEEPTQSPHTFSRCMFTTLWHRNWSCAGTWAYATASYEMLTWFVKSVSNAY